jgi:hypothetical protein
MTANKLASGIARAFENLKPLPDKKLADEKPKTLPKPRLVGRSGKYVTYNFPVGIGNTEIRKEIGFARVPGVTGFRCGNCKHFRLRFCTIFHIGVLASDCCAAWEHRA